MSRRKPLAPIAITMGDPAGVGPEVILKAAAAMMRSRGNPELLVPELLVVGDLEAMRQAAHRLGGVPEPFDGAANGAGLSGGLRVLSVGKLAHRAIVPGRGSVEGSDAAYRYIVVATQMALRAEADAVVTAPINKEWLNRAGHHFPGHSELLAALSRVRLWRMMFAGDQLRLALVTVHMALGKVSRALNAQAVLDTIRLLQAHLRERMGIRHPRIGVLGFNPHAGENGLFGDEEIRAIAPAIKRAQREQIDAYGPLAPDTAFIRPGGKFGFDAAVAMYHDQGLIALKTLEFDRAVNITLGLPFVRTSPDHGTAYDLAGTGQADPRSMIAAIEYASRASSHRNVVARPAVRATAARQGA